MSDGKSSFVAFKGDLRPGAWMKRTVAEGCQPRLTEHAQLDDNMPTIWHFCQNENRNAASQNLLYDDTRVVLESWDKKRRETDYIHASWIQVRSRNPIIITQAPLTKATPPFVATANEFWRMIWQESVQTIVCLTNKDDLPDVYWPQSKAEKVKTGDSSLNFQQYTIEFVAEEKLRGFNRTDLNITCKTEASKQTRHVFIFDCLNWRTDLSPPDDKFFFEMMENVWETNGLSADEKEPPTVIHDVRDGTIRSGIYAAMHLACHQMKVADFGFADVLKIVKHIATSRYGTVTDKHQYVIIFKLVLQYAVHIGQMDVKGDFYKALMFDVTPENDPNPPENAKEDAKTGHASVATRKETISKRTT